LINPFGIKESFWSRRKAFLLFLPAFIITVGILVPFGYSVVMSFTDFNLTSGTSNFIGFGNYLKMTKDSEFWNSLKVTLLFTLGAVLFEVGIGFIAAYLLNLGLLGQKLWRTLFLLPVMLPPTVAAIMWKLMMAYQLITLPFSVWLMRGFFEDIPIELEHAARIDGYSWWGVFRKVNLPLVAPGIAATAILSFIFAWNEFLFGYVLSSDITRPVTPSLMGFISYEQVLWGQMAAAAIITLLPSVILAIFIQKYLVRGLTFGAVKG
jgi:multiple sugar transport system permease protein